MGRSGLICLTPNWKPAAPIGKAQSQPSTPLARFGNMRSRWVQRAMGRSRIQAAKRRSMSIWTSKSVQACTLLGAGLFLFGCSGGGAPYAGPLPDVDTEIAVTSDRLEVTGPDGFCIDPAATQDRGISAFVLLGNCAAIGNSPRLPQPEHPSILTAAISEAGPEGSLRSNIPAMAAFFTSEQGRGLLSRDQDPNSVEILDMFHQGDVFFLNARDSSASSIRGVKEDYWRVYMDVGNRIATLSVLALED